jgi:hypothetical protein
LNGIANRAGDAIVELVSNVLTSALIDAGESVYEPLPVDLAQITSEVVGTLEIPATQKSLRLVAEVENPAGVLGDATWLRQIVSNLVMNAIKFTEKGGQVNVRVRTRDRHVQLEVQDTGVGIPAEKRGQVVREASQAPRGRYGGRARLGPRALHHQEARRPHGRQHRFRQCGGPGDDLPRAAPRVAAAVAPGARRGSPGRGPELTARTTARAAPALYPARPRVLQRPMP